MPPWCTVAYADNWHSACLWVTVSPKGHSGHIPAANLCPTSPAAIMKVIARPLSPTAPTVYAFQWLQRSSRRSFSSIKNNRRNALESELRGKPWLVIGFVQPIKRMERIGTRIKVHNLFIFPLITSPNWWSVFTLMKITSRGWFSERVISLVMRATNREHFGSFDWATAYFQLFITHWQSHKK